GRWGVRIPLDALPSGSMGGSNASQAERGRGTPAARVTQSRARAGSVGARCSSKSPAGSAFKGDEKAEGQPNRAFRGKRLRCAEYPGKSRGTATLTTTRKP